MVPKTLEAHELVVAAIKAANSVRTKDDVTRCIDVLKRLKGLSLSAKDLLQSSSPQKLESLRDHRNPKIRAEVRSLFCSWMGTLYAKPATLRCSVSKNNGERCETTNAAAKNETQLLELFETAKKAADTANVKGILSGQSEASRCVDLLSKLMSFTVTRKFLKEKRIVERLEHLAKHKNRKICSAAAVLLQLWKESIMNQGRQASVTKISSDTLLRMLYASGRTDARKAVGPLRQKEDPLEVSGKPRSSVLKRVENNRRIF